MYELAAGIFAGKYKIHVNKNGQYYRTAAYFEKVKMKLYRTTINIPGMNYFEIDYQTPQEGFDDLMPLLKEYYCADN